MPDYGQLVVVDELKPDRVRSTARAPKVLAVSNDRIIAELLSSALSASGFAARSTTFQEIATSNVEWHPDVVLLEIGAEEAGTTVELIERVRRTGVSVAVMLRELSTNDEDVCRDAGAALTLSTSSSVSVLVACLRKVIEKADRNAGGEGQTAPQPVSVVGEKADAVGASPLLPFSILTPRERVVLAELMEGYSAESIARRSWVAMSTVRSQIKAILQKLGVNSQLAAVALARQAGWYNENGQSP
jgi:two-component system, NarL family, nitrate/nitrite response regulator NarL